MESYIVPVILVNLITISIILVCFKWPRTGFLLWAFIFIGAGIFNLIKVQQNPEAYILTYGATTISLTYKYLIYLVIAPMVKWFISLVAVGQLMLGVMLLFPGFRFWGILGAITFFILITPLGMGAAFPMPVFALIALLILYSKLES